MDTAFFYLFALLVLGGAIMTITRRNAIHSAISLIVSLMGVAGLYLLQKAEALACVVLVGAQVFYFIRQGSDALRLPPAVDTSVNMTKGNTEMIADALFSEYLLPFEIASLLLLVAVVGSVVMAKKRI